jgi:predicted lipoprotein
LALILAGDDADLSAALTNAFTRSEARIARLDDPAFAGVSDPSGRFAIEALQQSVGAIQTVVRNDLGPKLGVVAGFNALDGD